jgi:hypothetical protein
MSFIIEAKAGKIAQNFIAIEVQGCEDVDKDALNLIDFKELESLLKKGAETMLFCGKEWHEIDDLNAVSEAGPADALQVDWTILNLSHKFLSTDCRLPEREDVHRPDRNGDVLLAVWVLTRHANNALSRYKSHNFVGLPSKNLTSVPPSILSTLPFVRG